MNLADDPFTLFGLPPRMTLDRAALDERWRRLQGEVHPDRFAAEGAAAQRVAMQWAVRVNEAYAILKDPLRRAECLCGLRGVPVQAERHTDMPAGFLMQQMAWREALDDAATDGNAAAVQALADDVTAQERQTLAHVQSLLDDVGDVPAAAQQVRVLMFLQKFRRDIDRRLDALESP